MRDFVKFNILPRFLLGGILYCAILFPSLALTTEQLKIVESAAQQGLKLCLKEMHHDTDEFVKCVNNLLVMQKMPQEKQLGFAYLGLVGCLSALRISTLHSDICSKDYLVLTDKLMREFQAKDLELCPMVAGNCSMRIAQIKSIRKEKALVVK